MICICDHTWWLFEFLLSVLFDCATWFRRALENSVHGGFRNAVFSCSSFHAESGLFRFLDYFEFLFDGETRREPTALPCISILEQNPWSRSCQKIKSRFLSWISREKAEENPTECTWCQCTFFGGICRTKKWVCRARCRAKLRQFVERKTKVEFLCSSRVLFKLQNTKWNK